MIGAHAQHLCQRKAAEGIKGVKLVFIFSCYNTDLTTQHLFLPLLSAALNLSLPPPGPRGDDRITDHADKCGCRHPPSLQPLWYFKHSQCADFASLIYRCGGGGLVGRACLNINGRVSTFREHQMEPGATAPLTSSIKRKDLTLEEKKKRVKKRV